MKKQKIVALLLVAAIMLPMSTTSFAASTAPTEIDKESSHTAITINSDLKLPVLKVTIGSYGNVTVNPYKMDFDPGDGSSVNDSFFSAPTSLVNESTIDVKVKATPSAKTDSNDLKILSAPPDDSVTVPSLFMQYTMKSGLASATDYTTYDGTTPDAQVVIKETNAESCEMTMAKKATNPTYGAIKILGKSAGPNWDESDKVTITVVFDIIPVIAP